MSQIFTLGILLVSVPLLVGTVLTFIYIERLSDESHALVVRSMEIGRETERIVDHIEELNRAAQQYMVVKNEEIYSLYAQKHSRLIDMLGWLDLLVEAPETGQVIDDIHSVSISAFEEIKSVSGESDVELDESHFDELAELSESLSFFSNAAMRKKLNSAASRVDTARTVLYWTWGISLLFMLAFAAVFVWFIARPVRRMDEHIRRLGQGRFEEPVKIDGPADIAKLGIRLDWLRRRLSDVGRIKERFFREMSHQLKTPLASIREGTELLMGDGTELTLKDRREVLDLLYDNSVELQRMLENMLKFSAWRDNPENLYRERFYMEEMIENVASRFQSSILSRSLSVQVKCPHNLEVELDREKCRVIVDNLLSNAVKCSPAGGEIVISVCESGRFIYLDVVDQGSGIPEQDRNRVFELFYLGGEAEYGQSRGTGVGLALVKAYTEAHGGTVRVEPTQGKGAHIRVTFPQAVS